MKKVFKKNQVIITALAIMIAVAGYLSFSDVDFGMKEASTETADNNILEDIESLDYDVSDETALIEENAQSTTTQVSPAESPAGQEGEETVENTQIPQGKQSSQGPPDLPHRQKSAGSRSVLRIKQI